MKTVLLTRPKQNAEQSIARLSDLGYKALNCSVFKTIGIPFTAPDVSNLIVTSQNGVEHGLRFIKNTNQHIFAVGEKTATRARALGFHKITTSNGNGKSLVETIINQDNKQAPNNQYCHLAGTELAFDVSTTLNKADILAEKITVYRTVAVNNFQENITASIKKREIDAALFYSAQGATIFEDIMRKNQQTDALRHITAISLSNRIDSHLKEVWLNKKIAKEPNENSLFDALKW
jgi:uroporphyrinogen-III synthase